MMMTLSRITLTALASVFFALVGPAAAETNDAQGRARCQGQERRGGGRGMGMGMGMDADHETDMETFRFLLDHRDAIDRTVTELSDGVETVTGSDDPEIAAQIREHVRAMYARLEENRPIHRRDPLFAEIFRHASQIEMTIEDTDRGLRVRETSSDPYVVKLIQSHARVVSEFIENGHQEMMRDHPVPEK